MKGLPKPDLLWPAPMRKASELPARLFAGNASFWQDICDVLLDPEADRHAVETVRRWLRDEVERDLLERIENDAHGHMTEWACRLSPRMIWKLPCSIGRPPERSHGRIAAVLLPHKLAQVERQLARLAFQWRMGPLNRRPGSSPPPPLPGP